MLHTINNDFCTRSLSLYCSESEIHCNQVVLNIFKFVMYLVVKQENANRGVESCYLGYVFLLLTIFYVFI